jgi:N,N'-diacetyllegionaminate synthase
VLKKPFIIAEIGNNHEGNFSTAVKLVEEAAKAGVDAVKFQTFEPDQFINSLETKRFKTLKKFKLSDQNFINLAKIAKNKKLKFISTPLDIRSAYFLKDKVDMIKIASSDNNYYDLINLVLSFKIPTIFSTGLLESNELKKFLRYVKNRSKNFNDNYFLHCVSSYPTTLNNVNLERINFIKKLNIKNVGFSDHTVGFSAPLASFFYGVKIIEKHFTLDNNFSKFRDHKLSLNPKDMAKLVSMLNDFSDLQTTYNPKLSKDESKNILSMRRSFYAKKKILKKTILTKDHIKFVRPSKKNSFNLSSQLIGKRIIRDLKEHTHIKKEDIKH